MASSNQMAGTANIGGVSDKATIRTVQRKNAIPVMKVVPDFDTATPPRTYSFTPKRRSYA